MVTTNRRCCRRFALGLLRGSRISKLFMTYRMTTLTDREISLTRCDFKERIFTCSTPCGIADIMQEVRLRLVSASNRNDFPHEFFVSSAVCGRLWLASMEKKLFPQRLFRRKTSFPPLHLHIFHTHTGLGRRGPLSSVTRWAYSIPCLPLFFRGILLRGNGSLDINHEASRVDIPYTER